MTLLHSSESVACGAHAVFWPDVEACDAECILPLGHEGPHRDAILGEWDEDDLPTTPGGAD